MNFRHRINRIERCRRERVCPRCAGRGGKAIVVVHHGGPPDPSQFTCPECGAAPPCVKVIHLVPDEDESGDGAQIGRPRAEVSTS
jgi:hypothetical protein